MRRFQRVQKLVCWSKQMLFYDTWKFLSIFENWNIFNLGLTQSSKLYYNLWFREVLRAVKGKYGQGNIHTWVWNKNYPVLNQNYWSDTVNLNWASVAIFFNSYCICSLCTILLSLSVCLTHIWLSYVFGVIRTRPIHLTIYWVNI